MVIAKATRETRFLARAARVDSTVVEADIRYPSDAMLALQGAQALAARGPQAGAACRTARAACATGRGRSAGWCGRSRQTLAPAHRRGASEQVLALNRRGRDS